jgi:chaperonin GroES
MAYTDEQQEVSLSPEEFIAGVLQADNIASLLSEQQQTDIAHDCLRDYDMDKQSMSEWYEIMKRGMDLAKLVKEKKTYPFEGAANVKYPLIASAALQFNARAYPAIVAPDGLVKTKVNGNDPMGKKAARGDRVADFMSHQLTNDMVEWEEGTDHLLLQLPIVGHMYRKVWFDPIKGRPCSRVIDPGKLIVNDRIKSLEDAPRISEELPLFPDEIESRIRAEYYVDFDYTTDEDDQEVQDFIEQHCRIDLDEDGYAEPYVATIHVETKTLVRLTADFNQEDVKFQREMQQVPMMVPARDPMTGQVVPVETMQEQEVVSGIMSISRGAYFVDYRFWPAMDGSYHGVGLGMLLGDISDTINTIFNLLMDAGHYAALGGGFIGTDFRLKGGAQRMRPGEWRLANNTGQDIRNSIVPLTFPGPDGTLFQMLGMLIEAGREIASVKDIMTGDSQGLGANASPTTTLALIEQGMMVFTAAYKRIFRSLRKEYKLLCRINAETLDPQAYNAFLDDMDQQGQPVMHDPRQDFGAADMDIVPVADPRSVTRQQEMAKADLLMNMAGTGMANPAVAAQRVFEAANIDNVDELIPQPDPMQQAFQQEMTQLQLGMGRADLTLKAAELDEKIADIQKTRSEIAKNMNEIDARQADQRLRAVELVLSEESKRLAELIRAETQRMARAPGDNSGAGNAANGGGNAQGGDLRSLLGGAGQPGGQAAALAGAMPGVGRPY